ncbi:CU044_5270 family protein [Streptomyces sp. NPDC004100]
MDEMTEVRALRAHVPAPDRARLAPGRTRLTEAARVGRSRRARWLRREFALVGVVAAVTAVAVAATLLVGSSGSRDTVRPATTPDVRYRGVTTAEFLRQAADAVQTQPDGTVPTAKQWIYTKEAQEPPQPVGRTGRFVGPEEKWIRYDGSAMTSRFGDEPLHIMKMHLENGGEGDDRSPREMYRVLAALPTDGKGTLKALREQNAIADDKGSSQARNDYTEISVLLSNPVMPAKGLASLYRALALLPGGKVTGHLVKDAAGRRVIALNWNRGEPSKTGGSMLDQWLIDPQTHRIVGERIVSTHGKVLGGSSLFTTAVVDRPGTRP